MSIPVISKDIIYKGELFHLLSLPSIKQMQLYTRTTTGALTITFNQSCFKLDNNRIKIPLLMPGVLEEALEELYQDKIGDKNETKIMSM